MKLEELKQQSDADEIKFLDILAAHQSALDKLNNADVDLRAAQIARDIARMEYQISSAKYSVDLQPFMNSRRAYLEARSKES